MAIPYATNPYPHSKLPPRKKGAKNAAKILSFVTCSPLLLGPFLAGSGVLFRPVAGRVVLNALWDSSRAALKGMNLRGQTPICGFLRVPAGFCAFLRKLEAPNPEIPKKNTAFTRTFAKSSLELLPASLWRESGKRLESLRKTCSDELLFLLGDGFFCFVFWIFSLRKISGFLRTSAFLKCFVF